MAGRTSRFRFSVVGGAEGGSFTDDDQKYSSSDRVLLDTLLTQVEGNDYHLHTAASAAVGEISLTAAEGGDLVGGQTYYYRYALLDANGIESAASDEISISLPAPLDPPGAPATSMNEGDVQPTGVLPADLYYYALTATRGSEESVLGATLMVRVSADITAVTLALPDLDGADGFRVWRMGSKDPGYTMIGTTSDDAFVDDGYVPASDCACDPENLPPSGAANAQIYAVTAHVSVVGAGGWNLYRTTESGYYSASSLVESVTALVDEDDLASGVVADWTDLGDALSVGSPQDENLNMVLAPYTFEIVTDELPDPVPYPTGYPLVLVIDGVASLYVQVPVDDGSGTDTTVSSWLPVSSGGSGGGGGVSPVPTVYTSPGGRRFILAVDDDGAIITVPTRQPGPAPTMATDVTITWERA